MQGCYRRPHALAPEVNVTVASVVVRVELEGATEFPAAPADAVMPSFTIIYYYTLYRKAVPRPG